MGSPTTHYEPIDLNRGVKMKLRINKPTICMYKDSPGVYYNSAGAPVSEAVAADAGFDVKHQVGERLVREKMEKYEADLRADSEKKVEEFREEVESEVQAEVASPPKQKAGLDSGYVTKTNATGAPRATKFHLMKHITRGMWNVIHIDSGVVAAERIKTKEAEDFILEEAHRLGMADMG